MSEWIAIGSACPRLGTADETATRRKELLHLIAEGLIKARSFRSKRMRTTFNKDEDLAVFAQVIEKRILDRCSLSNFESVYERPDDYSEVRYIDVMHCPLETSNNWFNQKRDDFSIIQNKADWESGHFHHRHLFYAIDGFGCDESTGFIYHEADFYSVEVERDAVTRLMGMFAKSSPTHEPQSTKYDWEAAFADVAARFYHDLEFENIEARGVQADIERLLIASFENRGVAVPSIETCKPKARKLLGALRGAKPKKPQ